MCSSYLSFQHIHRGRDGGNRRNRETRRDGKAVTEGGAGRMTKWKNEKVHEIGRDKGRCKMEENSNECGSRDGRQTRKNSVDIRLNVEQKSSICTPNTKTHALIIHTYKHTHTHSHTHKIERFLDFSRNTN